MGWKDKLNGYIRSKREQMQRGVKVTQQMKAERQRKRTNKLIDAKPGAVTAIRKGLSTRSRPMDVMKDEYSRRKYEREQGNKGKFKD